MTFFKIMSIKKLKNKYNSTELKYDNLIKYDNINFYKIPTFKRNLFSFFVLFIIFICYNMLIFMILWLIK